MCHTNLVMLWTLWTQESLICISRLSMIFRVKVVWIGLLSTVTDIATTCAVKWINKWWFGGSTSTKWFFIYLIPDRIGIWKCWFLKGGEYWRTQRKTSQSKGENQQQTQPTYGVGTRIWTWATLMGGERSHHCTIPCSPASVVVIFRVNVSGITSVFGMKLWLLPW